MDLLQQILAAAVPKYLERSPVEGLVDLDVMNGETYEPPISKRLRAALDAVPVDSSWLPPQI